MSDFLNRVEAGKRSTVSKGLKSGLTKFSNFINNIQKETYTAIGAMKKSGKTAFIDYNYILTPYLLNPDVKVKWYYFSLEVSRIKKMAKFAAFFMWYKYNKIVSANYILSLGENKLSDEDELLVKEIYANELKDLFGEWDASGRLIKEGKIVFIEDRINPTGIRSLLLDHFESNGKTLYTEYNTNEGVRKRRVGYEEKDPELFTIVLVDHVGLLQLERGYNKKENIDKFSQYMIDFRNTYKATIIVTSQFNRDLSKIDRLKFSGDVLQPNAEDFKDTGNLAEDVSMLIALFNPNAYPHINKHLGYDISKLNKRYISLHLLESRDTEGFVDLGLNFVGECGIFKELPHPDKMTAKIYNDIINNKYVNYE